MFLRPNPSHFYLLCRGQSMYKSLIQTSPNTRCLDSIQHSSPVEPLSGSHENLYRCFSPSRTENSLILWARELFVLTLLLPPQWHFIFIKAILRAIGILDRFIPSNYKVLAFKFCKWENWPSEHWGDLPKAIKLEYSSSGILNQSAHSFICPFI